MLRVANAVVAVVAVCLVMASCVLASIRSASAGANYKWFQPNLVRRNGHSHRHHHVRTHVDVLENGELYGVRQVQMGKNVSIIFIFRDTYFKLVFLRIRFFKRSPLLPPT